MAVQVEGSLYLLYVDGTFSGRKKEVEEGLVVVPLNKYSDAQLSFLDGVGAERKRGGRRKRKEEQRERGDIMSDVCYDVSAVLFFTWQH